MSEAVPDPSGARGRSTLRALSARAQLPASLHHQRRMAELLTELRREAGPGAFDVRVGAHRIDGLDLIVNDLLQSGGATLGFVDLLGTAAELAEADRIVSVPVHLPELWRAARVLRRGGLRVEVRSSDGLSSRMRMRFYPWVKLARSLRDALRRAPDGADDGPAVLFVVQVPHHVGDLAGVARRLRDVEGEPVAFLPADGPTAAAVVDAGFEPVAPPRPSLGEVAALVAGTARVGLRVERTARRLRRRNGSPELVAFHATVRALVAEQLLRTLLVARDAELIVGRAPVRAVVVANPYSRAGRAAARVAEAAGTAVVTVEHGSIFPDDPRWADCPVSAVCTWGEASRRALLTCGVPPERVVVTGAPRYDTEPAAAVHDAADDPRPRGGRRRVLVATSGPGDHVSLDIHLRFVDALTAAVRAAPEVTWVIKLHPKDRTEHYEPLLGLANVMIVRGDQGGRSSIFDHLADADCLVTVSSTTAIDALRARVPVVAVWLTDDRPPEFVARTAARTVGDGDALAAAAVAAVRGELDPPDATYLGEHFAGSGHATEAVVAVIDACAAAATRRAARPR